MEPRQLLAVGDSLMLDGVNDYVEVSQPSAVIPQQAMTLEAWVHRDEAGRGSCQAVIGGGPAANALVLALCAGKIHFRTSATGTEGTTVIPGDTWTHIAVTWEGGGQQRFYVNGALDFAGPAPSQSPSGAGRLYIGARIQSGTGLPVDDFAGHIAEVRIWDVARTQDQIRHTMHVALEEPRPGLLANWHFNANFRDNIGSHDGTAHGDAKITGLIPPTRTDPPAPPVPARAAVDKDFGALPEDRFGAASAYIPSSNQALLIGGTRLTKILPAEHAETNRIDRVDVASGVVTQLGTLPGNLVYAAAAYSPDDNRVYVFGGSQDGALTQVSDVIYSINPQTGATQALAAKLPAPAAGLAAVYDGQLNKIYLFGGRPANAIFNTPNRNTVWVFDPVTQTVSTAAFSLPQGRADMAAVYSQATGTVFLFGGRARAAQLPSNIIYEVTVDTNGSSGTVVPLSVTLPSAQYGLTAAEDPVSTMIYVVGGSETRVLAFDAITRQLWRTPVELLPPGELVTSVLGPFSSSVYSPRNRHLVAMGGTGGSTALFGGGRSDIWRIPLGDGPALPLGRWDFPAPVPNWVTAIHGDEDHVVVGTQTNGAYRYDADASRFHYTPSQLGSRSGKAAINDVYYDAEHDLIWLSTQGLGAKQIDDGTITTFNQTQLDTNNVLTVDPVRPFFGTESEGLKSYFPLSNFWRTDLAEHWILKTARRGRNNEIWMLAGIITDPDAKDPTYELWRMNYTVNPFPSSNSQTFGKPGFNAPGSGLVRYTDLAFDPNSNWWITSDRGVVYIPAAETPNQSVANVLAPVLGVDATAVDVDADGRVWVAVGSDATHSGGLVAYESKATNDVSTGEFNWLNAPVGTKISIGSLWDSSFQAVGAVDERVWAGRADGEIVTVAQRWQQLDESNRLDEKVVHGVWTARGRAFLASQDGLHILQPDGQTWDNRADIHVNTVMADSAGNIWVGADDGVRLYLPEGWLEPTGTVTTPPTGPVYAIEEDSLGRIWIGSAQGLTLFDNGNFVFTLNAANFGLPDDDVRTLLADNDNQLWIGTDAGLARLKEGSLSVFTTANGLVHNDIHDLAQLGSGEIAISTAGGLSFYQGGSFTTQTLPIPAVDLPLSVDEVGRLWAGSAVRTGSTWQGYYWTNSGLRSSKIRDNASDGADRIWFSHAPDTGVSIRGAYLPPLKDAVPIITGVEPRFGTAGDILHVKGGGFGKNKSELSVVIGGAKVEIVDVANNDITVRLKENNISGAVSVTRSGRTTTFAADPGGGPAFCAVPTIGNFTPTGGNAGVEVTVTGTNFDPDVKIRLGGSPFRSPIYHNPTRLETFIISADTDGLVRLRNHCDAATATSPVSFNKINLSVTNVVLNQGIQFYGLVQNKPTFFQYFIGTDSLMRPTDTVEIDVTRITLTSLQTGQTMTLPPQPNPGLTFPTRPGSPTAAQLASTAASLNFSNVKSPFSGPVSISTVFQRNRSIVLTDVATNTSTVEFAKNSPLRVLMVPIMPDGSSSTETVSLLSATNAQFQHLRERIFPQGTVEIEFSSPIFAEEIEAVEPWDLGEFANLYLASHELDEKRAAFNDADGVKHMDIVMGIVHPNLVNLEDGNLGQAFWPDLSALLNASILNHLDFACDVFTAPLMILGFEGCDLEIPMFVGWAAGLTTTQNGPPGVDLSDGAGQLFGHEIGHTLGLVKSFAPNGSFDPSLLSHSVNTSIHGLPGVTEPVVDPIGGTQFFASPGPSQRMGRVMMKPTMNQNDDSFFEPVDVGLMGFSMFPFFPPVPPPPPIPAPAISAAEKASAHEANLLEGPRLRVTGMINTQFNSGEIRRVVPFGESVRLTMSFDTPYQLVQLDAAGMELDRIGVYPLETNSSQDGIGLFAATVLRKDGVSRIELRNGEVVLDAFEAGSAAPEVSITGPMGGHFASGDIPLTWQGADPDGDPLTFFVTYSTNDGETWEPVDSVRSSSSMNVPVALLAGSRTARLRVTATDGLHRSSAVSEPFSVAFQPPQAFIAQPSDGNVFLQWQTIHLAGGALDNQDGNVADRGLRWSSDRDGDLGVGSHITTALSLGPHVITVHATNSAGLESTYSIALNVQGDYDRDGLADSMELALGLNPLETHDAFSDRDGDGLSLKDELARGLNASARDSDGDGRTDDQEILDGTRPDLSDPPPAADHLQVFPSAISVQADLSRDVPLPQRLLQVVSRRAADWTVEADVNWLRPLKSSGNTPDGLDLRIDTFALTDGVHTGQLEFRSRLLQESVFIPVEVTVVNRASYSDVNRDGRVDDADRQAVAAAVGLDYRQPGYDYRLDLDRNGVIDANDLLTIEIGVAIPGDLNGDGQLDLNDIDLLCQAIRSGDQNADLTGDGETDDQDLNHLVNDLIGTTAGDANLDRVFDSTDLIQVFQAGQYEDTISSNSTWGTGDWNCDGEFDSSDLVLAFQAGSYTAAARGLAGVDPDFGAADHLFASFAARAWRPSPRRVLIDDHARDSKPIESSLGPGRRSERPRAIELAAVDRVFAHQPLRTADTHRWQALPHEDGPFGFFSTERGTARTKQIIPYP